MFSYLVDRQARIEEELLEVKGMLGSLSSQIQALGRTVSTVLGRTNRTAALVEEGIQAGKCLENASREQALLAERHYQDHIIDPLVNSLVALVRLVEGTHMETSPNSEAAAGAVAKLKATLRGGLEELLSVYGVETFTSAQGTPFDKLTMRVVRVVPTDDPALDWKVARSLLSGIRRQKQILNAKRGLFCP
ncbi:MAG: hypothetical protein J7M19_03935 [Planctomycetes bacterium]|nr:hypothetical protein [Planctomycetota bacterium]